MHTGSTLNRKKSQENRLDIVFEIADDESSLLRYQLAE